jgi:hypothetical protein
MAGWVIGSLVRCFIVGKHGVTEAYGRTIQGNEAASHWNNPGRYWSIAKHSMFRICLFCRIFSEVDHHPGKYHFRTLVVDSLGNSIDCPSMDRNRRGTTDSRQHTIFLFMFYGNPGIQPVFIALFIRCPLADCIRYTFHSFVERGKTTRAGGHLADSPGKLIRMSKESRTMVCNQCGAENLGWRSRCQSCNALLHEEEINIKLPHGVIWWTAFIISLVYAFVFFFFMVVMGGLGWVTYLLSASIPDFFPILLTVLAFLSLILAWKWQLAGGILLIIFGLLLVIGLAIFQDFGFAVFYLPIPILGILFIISWMVAQKYTTKEDD